MLLRSRSMVRHSCSGAPAPHRSRVAPNTLWKPRESERLPITTAYYHVNPPTSRRVWGWSAAEEKSSTAGNWKHAVVVAEGERGTDVCRCSGAETQRRDNRCLICVLNTVDFVLHLTDVAPVYEQLGSKSVSTTTKSPLDGAVWFCKTTGGFCYIYHLK